MQIKVDITGLTELKAAMARAPGQVNYALAQAMNKTMAQAKSDVQTNMTKVFDRPTPWVINSLRIKYASKTKLSAELAFKDINSAVNARTMVAPHVDTGTRTHKAMEARLRGIGMLPTGWFVVPGAGATLDAYGNMSRGQISQLLNVLGAYTEAGYNKANDKTSKRLAKGNAKKNQFGFVYFVQRVSDKGHLLPGVYQRVKTGFGSSLKPILIFVNGVSYKKRLDFYGIVQADIDRDLNANFEVEFKKAIDSALIKSQGSLL